MSQISVPAVLQDSNPDGAIAVGAGNFVTAVNDPNQGKYIQLQSDLVSGHVSFFTYELQHVDDPGIDVGFTLRAVARWDTAGPGGVFPTGFFVTLLGEGDPFNVVFIDFTIDGESPTFIEIVRPLTALEVQNLRAGGFFGPWINDVSGPTIELFMSTDLQDPADELTLRTAFIQFEAPDAGPPPPTPDVEITSDAGIEFGGSNFIEFVSDVGLLFNFSAAQLVFNEFLSDAGLEFGGGGLASGNAFTSDAGLVFGMSAADIILSVDASGIYTIVPGKRYDTIYARNNEDLTEDVKIPNPLWKTGYVGG